MNIIKVIIFAFGITHSIHAFPQDVSFYIQIEDPEIVPTSVINESSDDVSFLAKTTELNELYSKYHISKFEIAFPTAVTPSLKNVYHVECDDKNLGIELSNRYKEKIPRLEFLEKPTPTYTPNDYSLEITQTNLDLINTKDAWDYILGLPIIDVAVSDTYFDMSHEDLSMTLVGGTNNPNVPSDWLTHGTAVAGLVGTITDNNIGLASVAFNSDLAVSSIRSDNEVLLLAQAGYRVINCSWMGQCYTIDIQEELYDEIKDVWGAIVVFGAGNEGSKHCGNNNPSYPASYDSNIAVTSVGHKFDVGTPGSPASNWKDVHENIIGDSLSAHKHHPTMDICAPGYNVPTTDLMGSAGTSSGNYKGSWGTSFAAPQVSGALALILSINPCLSADEAVNILLSNADNSIYNITENLQYIGRLGTGRLDVEASVAASVETATTYLENMIISGNETIEDNYAIRAINGISISSGADVTFKTRKEVTISSNFEVADGAELYIDVNVNNNINCN
jgi:hypothetical protein